MKHPLGFVQNRGQLAEALGISRDEARVIEALVEHAIAENHSMRQLFEAVGELDISDELWANFLYTLWILGSSPEDLKVFRTLWRVNGRLADSSL